MWRATLIQLSGCKIKTRIGVDHKSWIELLFNKKTRDIIHRHTTAISTIHARHTHSTWIWASGEEEEYRFILVVSSAVGEQQQQQRQEHQNREKKSNPKVNRCACRDPFLFKIIVSLSLWFIPLLPWENHLYEYKRKSILKIQTKKTTRENNNNRRRRRRRRN